MIQNQQSQPPTDSSTGSEGWKPPTATSQVPADPRRSAWISGKCRQVLSSYRKDDFADPDGFLIQLGMVLERYTDQIIDYATNPVSGIQRVSKWPPSIAEVVTHCDGEVERLAKIAKYKALGQPARLPPPPRPPESNYEEMVAKHGRPIGMFERGTGYEQYAGRRTEGRKQEFKRLTADDLRAIYAANDGVAA